MSKLKPSFRRPSDLAFSIFLFSLGSAIGLSANADSWNAPDHGYLIQINPPANGIAQQASSQSTLSGRVTFVPSPLDPEETVSDLSSAIGQDGVSIRLYFPDYSNEVTSKASFQPGNGYTSFTYKTDALDPVNLNTFIVQVIHQSDDYLALQQTQAKIDQRVAILNQLIQSLQGSVTKPDQNRLAALIGTRDQLKVLSSKIAAKLSSANQVLSERKFPLQVANSVSSPSSSLMLMGGFKLEHSFDVGSAIQGESTVAHSKVTRVYMSNGTSKFYWITDFSWQGQNTKSVGPQQLAVGDSLSNDTSIKNADPSALNQLSVAVNRTNNGNSQNRKLYGSLALDEPVAIDNTPPHWATSTPVGDLGYVKSVSAFNGTLIDDFGLIDRSTLSAQIVGNSVSGQAIHQDWTPYFTSSVPDQGQSLLVSGDPVNASSLPEGTYQVTLSAADLAGNGSPNWSTRFVLDHTPPVVQIGYNSGDADGQLTRAPGFSFSLTALDYSPVSATVLLNGQPVFSQSNQTHLSQNVALTLAEGPNTIEVDAVDAAGNASAPITITRVLDTTPPLLSLSQPKDSAVYTSLSIPVSGTSNEPLSSVTLNSQALTLSSDKRSFSGTFTGSVEGAVSLQVVGTDLAGNSTTLSVTPLIILRVLNPNLLSVIQDPDGTHLVVRGAAGATRPGDSIDISAGFFNRVSVTAGSDGSFSGKLQVFQSATVTAYDSILGRSESASVSFGSTNILLSGQVRDTNDAPVAGVTVSLASGVVQPVQTDATGTFSFTQTASGDQVLVIDGTTVPLLQPPAPQRRFSKTSVSISIGLSQSNVLQRPIYLTPLPLDGSATVIDIASGGTVTHPSAPGVFLQIPAGSATFPDGSSSGPVSVTTVPTQFSTISPMDFAIPQKVVALEPSGMTFSEPVTLTLPNENNLPNGTEMIILSMNSQKGIWEVGGLAKVQGNSVVTKPNSGILHFSTVYAVPMSPNVFQAGAQDMSGATAFDGAMSTAIKLPSYNSLGAAISPTLLYKSSWAKPTALVSNVFAFEPKVYSFPDNVDRGQQTIVDRRVCFLFICHDDTTQLYWDVTITGTQTLTPRSVKANFSTGSLSTAEYNFQKIPARGKVSFGVELKDPSSSQYLSTGIYPYAAHYEWSFDALIQATRTIRSWTASNPAPMVKQDTKQETRVLENLFPQDVGGPIFIQNETQSPFGRGWKAGGIAKIANPTSSRVLLEEADGTVSSFILNDTIQTIANGAEDNSDYSIGVDLSTWPSVYVSSADHNRIYQRNLESGSASEVGSLSTYSGTVAGESLTYLNNGSSSFVCNDVGCVFQVSGYDYLSCESDARNYIQSPRPSGILAINPNQVLVVDSARQSLSTVSNGGETLRFGAISGTPKYSANGLGPNGYLTYEAQMNSFCSQPGVSCAANPLISTYAYCNPANGDCSPIFGNSRIGNHYTTGVLPEITCSRILQFLDFSSSGSYIAAGFNGDVGQVQLLAGLKASPLAPIRDLL